MNCLLISGFGKVACCDGKKNIGVLIERVNGEFHVLLSL